MNYTDAYQKKLISVEDAVHLVKDNDFIFSVGAMSESIAFFDHLEDIKDDVRNVKIVNLLPAKKYAFYTDPSYNGKINVEGMFFGRFCRESQKAGLASFVPVHLRNSGVDRFYYQDLNGYPVSIYVIAVTPMDEHGFFSTGPTCLSNRALVERADIVIVEVNNNLPRTFGDTYIHISEVDYIFEGNHQVPYLAQKEITDTDRIIGKYVAELIDDGSTIQLGIGGIPNAVAEELKCKKDLGVHTEMLNDALVELYKCGAVNNSKKTLYKNRMVTTFTNAGKEACDFIHDNISVLHLDVAHVNSPYVIAQNRQMVSVNTTIQIDLMGQCASESIGPLQISGSGGQVDTAMGAKLSPDGKSIIAIHSTAMVKDETGNMVRQSRIVPAQPAGTPITLLRTDVDYVVTEYGIASLRGASLAERAEKLINIAHPDYRDELRYQAHKMFLL